MAEQVGKMVVGRARVSPTRTFPLNSGRLIVGVDRRIAEEPVLTGRHEANRWRQDGTKTAKRSG